MIVDLGTRALVIAEDEPSAAYSAGPPLTIELATGVASPEASRALVELLRFHGGMAPHALVGGAYRPGGDTLTVHIGEQLALSRRRTCRAALGRKRLFPGLPHELIEPALGGLSRTLDLGPGVVVLDRFGFDPVETSPLVTELAAELLGRVLSLGVQPSQGQVVRWLEALP
jgi:hypothetical protein